MIPMWGKHLWGKETVFFNIYLSTCVAASALAAIYGEPPPRCVARAAASTPVCVGVLSDMESAWHEVEMTSSVEQRFLRMVCHHLAPRRCLAA